MSSLKQQKFIFHFKNDYLNVFFLCLILAAVMFLPFLIIDKGYFLYYGDFNVQQIPFYKLANQAVKDGNIFWNWNTDLGSNFIGSYSFYLLGSPFFWLTLLFPNNVVPFLMAPLLMLKTACAGVTGFAFIKRFTASTQFAVIGALLYAFCGFNTYNIFFNHFHEAVVIFPLLLVALEETVINGRRGWFALTVFASAFINYFFFVGQVVFVILYFILRCSSKDFTINLSKFGILALEAVLGLLLSCALLLPSVLAILGNPRTENFYTGMSALMYGNEQRYGLILQSLFFPPDIPARPNFFPDSNAKWSSVSAYLPLFSMTGVIVFLKNQKSHWLKRILILSGLMAMVPILNSAFYAFNSSYYARWFYMPTLMMALATCLALERTDWDFQAGIRITAIVVLLFSVIGIMPTKVTDEQSGEEVLKWFGIPPYPERFWGYFIVAVLSLLILMLLLYLPRHSKKFFRYTALSTCIMILAYSYIIIGSGKMCSSSDIYTQIVEEGIHGAEKFDLEEDVFYRVDEDQAQDNLPMFWNMPTIQCFHSIVPVSVMEFYESIGVDRNVASRPEPSVYGVRALTSVKYLFCRTDKTEQPQIPGFEKIGVQNNHNVYENKYFVPMGFTYDYYVTRETYDNYNKSMRDDLLLRAICLSEEDVKTYGHLMTELPESQYPDVSDESYFESCRNLQKNAGSDFDYDNQGFTSKITLEQENLVFYSVPWEAGWSAKVNGKDAEIIRSNVGFMAVKAPAGENEIVFRYQTPGLKAGIFISLGALLIFMLYLLTIRFLRKKYPDRYYVSRYEHRKDIHSTRPIRAQVAYINNTLRKNTVSETEEE